MREDGTAVIARDKWNPDHSMEAMDNKPFLFEVGQKVVDIFSNVVTIKEILKYPPSKPGCCPEWNLLVEENGNCYRYTEIAGIYVRMVSAVELLTLTKEASLGLDKDLETEIEMIRKYHFINDDFDKAELDGRTISNIARHFAKWQKEHLMKDAKSGIVTSDNYIKFEDGTWIDLDPTMQINPAFSYKSGGKVRVLLIKEEENGR